MFSEKQTIQETSYIVLVEEINFDSSIVNSQALEVVIQEDFCKSVQIELQPSFESTYEYKSGDDVLVISIADLKDYFEFSPNPLISDPSYYCSIQFELDSIGGQGFEADWAAYKSESDVLTINTTEIPDERTIRYELVGTVSGVSGFPTKTLEFEV